MATRGKKYLEAAKLVDSTKAYEPEEAIELAKKAHFAKFDETVELHVRTALDPRNADQQLRGVALLPNGLGKRIRILVFTQGEGVRAAEAAGADHVGGDEWIKKIEEGWLEFDVAVATPDMMGKVGKLGKILGRRGLMPNPRTGTVVPVSDLGRVINESRKGRVEFKLDRTANIHLPIGKTSFETKQLVENLSAIVESIVRARPSGAKKQYIKGVTISTSMGPGIRLEMRSALGMTAS